MDQIKTIAITMTGVLLIAAGIALLVLPGPGILLIIAGLAVLARRFVWADDLLGRARTWREQRRLRRQQADSST